MGYKANIFVGGTQNKELADLIESVEVYERMGETTTYKIRCPVDINKGDIMLIGDKSPVDVGSTLSIIVTVKGKKHCLVKGPVYSQNIHLQHGGEGSWVEVIGADTSIKMDRMAKFLIFSDSTDSDAVTKILNYKDYDYKLDVDRTDAKHLEAKHPLVQRSTDLRFVKMLARRNGFLFWITYDAEGKEETAHFKRPPIDKSEYAELIIDQKSSNLDTLDILWNVERPTSIEASQLDLDNSQTNLDVEVRKTPQTILGDIGLIDITRDKRSVHLSAAVDDSSDLLARSKGALMEADWFTRAICHTSVNQLGEQLVRAHTMVNVSGTGSRHTGKYFVAGVRHSIDATTHHMELELLRNGWRKP